jgi:ApbE superfamily uncharacterized protein (UPF0280 family)
MNGAERAQVRLLPDGRRLHLQDGPIDLILDALGAPTAVAAAYRAAASRFRFVLDELCAELPALRAPALPTPRAFRGRVAQRMEAAVAPHAADAFITPMAAVAGSVADEILASIRAEADDDLARASVNNGGDIALYLAPGEATTVGLVTRPDRPASLFARARLAASDGVGGLATSGAPGRSFSLGVADAVSIFAHTAAEADAAATIVANAVDLPGDPRIERRPARSLQPDSDLGDRLVTRGVEPLDSESIATALEGGLMVARVLAARGLITAAALHLQGHTRICSAEGRLSALRAQGDAAAGTELLNA